MMQSEEGVREFLTARSCPPHVVAAGVSGLLLKWRRFVEEVEEGYAAGLEDYLNDLDLRLLLQDLRLGVKDALSRSHGLQLERIDRRFRGATRPSKASVYGNSSTVASKFDRRTHWWYFARPLRGPRELLDALPT